MAYRTQKYVYWFIIMAVTMDTMDIDNQPAKEIHRGWSGKGHRTSVSQLDMFNSLESLQPCPLGFTRRFY